MTNTERHNNWTWRRGPSGNYQYSPYLIVRNLGDTRSTSSWTVQYWSDGFHVISHTCTLAQAKRDAVAHSLRGR